MLVDRILKRTFHLKQETVFLCIMFISFFGLYMGTNRDLPLSSLMGKMKFVYIFFCIADIISHHELKLEVRSTLFVVVFAIYIVFFGFIVKYPKAHVEISNHRIMMSYFWFILTLTVIDVIYYKCLTKFIIYSYWCLASFVFLCAITHHYMIVWNPLYIIKMLVYEMRVGGDFGFTSSNYMGNYGFATLILSILQLFCLYDEKQLTRKYVYLTLCVDMFTFLVMQSASSRSPTISLGLFAIFGGYFELVLNRRIFSMETRRRIKSLFTVGIPTVIFLFFALGGWSYLWAHSNRQDNIARNLPYVGVIGTKWTGMGFIDNGGFISDAWFGVYSAFGVPTSALDMNYVFWYCTTGIIGCLIMGIELAFLLACLIQNRRNEAGGLMLGLYLVLLFYAFWETILFTYRFWPMAPLFIILLCRMSDTGYKKYFIW